MSKKIYFLIISSFLLIPSFVSAYVVGSSNFPLHRYEEFSEVKPYPPYDRDEYSYQQYRREVEAYVEAAKEYVEAGDNDIRRIRKAQEEAIDEANRAISEFNDWARR